MRALVLAAIALALLAGSARGRDDGQWSDQPPEIRAWFQRKQARSGKRVIAIKALANKMAKACYFMLRDGKDFDVKRLTG